MEPVEMDLAVFLEKLDAQLSDLPPARRAEILAETRAHLEAMMSARRADGMEQNEAWHSARQAFGEAQSIGRDLAREWRRSPRVETVGTPLSKHEKLRLFAFPATLALFIFVFSMLGLTDERWKSYWINGIIALITFGCAGYGFRSWRRAGGQWTPAIAFNWTLCVLQLLWANLYLTFGSQSLGASGESVSPFWLLAMFPLALLPFSILASVWLKRENKRGNTPFPWRQTSRYAQNPIAAEEIYRLAPKVGLVKGAALGCSLWLWMGWKFFGFGIAATLCVAEIAVAVFYARWLDGKFR